MKKITFILLVFPLFVFAQISGNLNPNYGNNGIFGVSKHSTFQTQDAALQGDKILIYGQMQLNGNSLNDVVFRVNSDGSLDKTFADYGVIELDGSSYLFSNNNYIETFVDGKFIICNNVGNANNQRAVLLHKFTIDGEKDISFGNNGDLLLNYLPYNASVITKPMIVPDASKVILPILKWNSVGNASTGSALHKLEANGSIDGDFGDNGYVDFENRIILSVDRNRFSSNWVDQIFGGVEGDMLLSMQSLPRNTQNFYSQYVKRSGAYTNNLEGFSASNSMFQGRFYEVDDIVLGKSSSLAILDVNGDFYPYFGNETPLYSYNTTMYNNVGNGTTSSFKTGFKVLQNGNFILFGTKFYSGFSGNFIISKIGYNDTNNDGLTDDFGVDGVNEFDLSGDDRMIDCFEKPNGKIVCIGSSEFFVNDSQESVLRRPSMVQMAANGHLDTSFGDGGVYLGNPYFKYGNGVVVKRWNGATGQIVPEWIGTATEPYSGKQRIERVFVNDPHTTSSATLTRTLFRDVKISNGITYKAFTQYLDAALVVGYVNNNGNNNFMLYRSSIYGNEFGGLTNEIVQTDINNGSDDKATAAVIQNDNGVKKILVVGESDGNLAMVRYFADGNDAGLIDTSFGINGIFSKSSSSKQKQATIPFVPNMVKSTDDGTIYMCGEEVNGNTHRFALKKFDASGNEDVGFQAFDELTGVSNVAQNFEILSDGSFIVIGQTGNFQTKIRKYNQNGTPDNNFGANSYLFLETSDIDAKLNDITILDDGRVAVVGYVDGEALVSLFSQDGILDAGFASNGILKTKYDFDSIKLTSVEQEDENNILITGTSEKDGASNVFSAQVLIQDALSVDEFDKNSFSVYPNPASSKINIKNNSNLVIQRVEIYNVLGEKLMSEKVESTIDVSNILPGIYFIKMFGESFSVSKRFVKK